MKSRIKKISVFRAAKIVAVLYFIISLVIFEPLALMAFFARAQGIAYPATANGRQPSPLLLMLAPIFYCIISFIFTALTCWLYNLVGSRMGGIEVELDQEQA